MGGGGGTKGEQRLAELVSSRFQPNRQLTSHAATTVEELELVLVPAPAVAVAMGMAVPIPIPKVHAPEVVVIEEPVVKTVSTLASEVVEEEFSNSRSVWTPW